jgi:hypothetical protein
MVKSDIVVHSTIDKNQEDLAIDGKSCPYCEYSINDINLTVYKQIFYKCSVISQKQ